MWCYARLSAAKCYFMGNYLQWSVAPSTNGLLWLVLKWWLQMGLMGWYQAGIRPSAISRMLFWYRKCNSTTKALEWHIFCHEVGAARYAAQTGCIIIVVADVMMTEWDVLVPDRHLQVSWLKSFNYGDNITCIMPHTYHMTTINSLASGR